MKNTHILLSFFLVLPLACGGMEDEMSGPMTVVPMSHPTYMPQQQQQSPVRLRGLSANQVTLANPPSSSANFLNVTTVSGDAELLLLQLNTLDAQAAGEAFSGAGSAGVGDGFGVGFQSRLFADLTWSMGSQGGPQMARVDISGGTKIGIVARSLLVSVSAEQDPAKSVNNEAPVVVGAISVTSSLPLLHPTRTIEVFTNDGGNLTFGGAIPAYARSISVLRANLGAPTTGFIFNLADRTGNLIVSETIPQAADFASPMQIPDAARSWRLSAIGGGGPTFWSVIFNLDL